MTTAHRPTWKAAVGKANEGGWSAGGAISTAVATLDAPSHKRMKFRQGPQLMQRQEALKKSLQALEAAEAGELPDRELDPEIEEQGRLKMLKQTAEIDETKLKAKYDDSDVDDGGRGSDSDSSSNLDDDDDDSDLDGDDSDDASDEDDEEALQAELAKIRAEREESKRKAEEEAATEENARQEESALLGNPLLAGVGVSGTNKRRWNEDVVFRNQAKNEPKQQKRFVNDTVRSDFHKRFLNKFIR